MGRKKVPSNRHGHMIKMAVMHICIIEILFQNQLTVYPKNQLNDDLRPLYGNYMERLNLVPYAYDVCVGGGGGAEGWGLDNRFSCTVRCQGTI